MYSTIKNAFVSGELSPSVFGRIELAKWHDGASTMRNAFVRYTGGTSSRAGMVYVGMCKQGAPNIGGTSTSNPPRDINFQFNINQGYALEFGDQYMRIKSNGSYITESATTISGATNANPLVITDTAHGYSNGDWIFITGMQGMTQLNGLTWIVTNSTTNTYHLTDLFGNVVNSTAYGTYTSSGTASRIYTVVAPYAAIDLQFLKFTQSADTMSLTCVNQDTLTEYPSYDLVRNSITNWIFTQTSYASSIAAPTNVVATAQSSTTLDTWYSYVVTAVSSANGEESIASTPVSVQNNNILINAGSNTITWNVVAGASTYNIYKTNSVYSTGGTSPIAVGVPYGYLGSAFGASFTDSNIDADFTKSPPTHQDPFARGAIEGVTPTSGGSGYTQAGIGYTINTTTGSGFSGTPIVVNGVFVAFLIAQEGKNYLPTDTITITGSGTGGTQATGSYTFNGGIPNNNSTIILNGVTWKFVTSGAVGNQTNIIPSSHGAVGPTIAQLQQDLINSANSSINVANYGFIDGANPILTITYKTTGTAGNSYSLSTGTYGGTVSGATLTGGTSNTGATANLIVGPNSGTYPGVVAYYQQRRGYANTINKPDTYFFSQPGAFTNMDSSTPTVDSDAIVGTPWAQQINGIQFMVPMTTGLIILTGNGAWLLNGGNNAALTPADQDATAQAYNGCNSHIAPIVINYDILYVQSKGSIVRDLSFNFFVNIFTGTDITVFSNHLFNFHQLQQWCYAQEPFKVVWAVRNDGTLLSLTYLKEQEVSGWARHDTNGQFVSICSVTEPPVDAVYSIVYRYIVGQGKWAYYSERMDNRNWQTAEDCICTDSALSYPMTFPDAILEPASATGTSNISSTNIINGGQSYTSPIAQAIDSTGKGVGATFSVSLSGGIITAVIPLTQGQFYTPGYTSIIITDSTGSGAVVSPIITNDVIFTTSQNVFTSGNIGDVIRIGNPNNNTQGFSIAPTGGGKAIITAYTSATQVTANILEPITNVVPDDPNNLAPAVSSGFWSISTPTATVTRLNHLEGMEVAILADGNVVENQTVVNGQITLPTAASAISIGLPFVVQIQTMYLEPPGQPNTSQNKRKNIYAVTARVESSRGFTVGTNQLDASTLPNQVDVPWVKMEKVKDRNSLIPPGYTIPLQTKDYYLPVPGDWNENSQVAFQQTNPLPLNLSACISWYQIGDSSS